VSQKVYHKSINVNVGSGGFSSDHLKARHAQNAKIFPTRIKMVSGMPVVNAIAVENVVRDTPQIKTYGYPKEIRSSAIRMYTDRLYILQIGRYLKANHTNLILGRGSGR
jgi:hypothetical protein